MEVEARFLIRELVEGLTYLQAEGVLHRDIKVCNLMLTDTLHLKIGDFGLATRAQSGLVQRHSSVCGTPNYMPPEVIKKLAYSFEVDVWSSGVLLFNLLAGRCPFTGETQKDTYENIVALRYRMPDNLSLSAQDLLRRMLCPKQRDRIRLEAILAHPFLSGFTPSSLPLRCFEVEVPESELVAMSNKDSPFKEAEENLAPIGENKQEI